MGTFEAKEREGERGDGGAAAAAAFCINHSCFFVRQKNSCYVCNTIWLFVCVCDWVLCTRRGGRGVFCCSGGGGAKRGGGCAR